MNKFLGLWCVSFVIFIKLFIILDIVILDLLLLKYVFGSFCKCVNILFFILVCIFILIICF